MNPPIFEVCAADAGVQAVLGDGPRIRLYPFGEALQEDPRPYAVWQLVYGRPENALSDRPDTDLFGVQIDVYAQQASVARGIAKVLRDSIEPFAHVVSWDGEMRDPGTHAYRYSFTVDWFVARP